MIKIVNFLYTFSFAAFIAICILSCKEEDQIQMPVPAEQTFCVDETPLVVKDTIVTMEIVTLFSSSY